MLTISLQVMGLKNYFLPFCPSLRAEADPELYLSSSCFSTVQPIPLLFLGDGLGSDIPEILHPRPAQFWESISVPRRASSGPG